MKTENYADFILQKTRAKIHEGINDFELKSCLKDFQKSTCEWAIKKGRSCIFADTGLGKTIMELQIADAAFKSSKKSVLILAPLSVSHQTVKEADKFGFSCEYIQNGGDIKREGIYITNYERFDAFDMSLFSCIILDESSILKSYSGKIRNAIIEGVNKANVPYRYAFTATPAPNDHMEIGNHSEFLGLMSRVEMLAMYFTHDGSDTSKWRLKKHGVNLFWEWISSWAVCFSLPSQIGNYSDEGYSLPPFKREWITVKTDDLPPSDGSLFRIVDMSATGIHKEGKNTAKRRAVAIAKIVNASLEAFIIWCNTNYEADEIKKLIDDAVECRGSDSYDKKTKTLDDFSDSKIRVLITKPSIAGFGLNWQHCHNMAFIGISYSYEDYYQSIRRCWRFGQKNEVSVYVATTDAERPIINAIQRKEEQHNEMKKEMASTLSSLFRKGDIMESKAYFGCTKGEEFEIHHGDCIVTAKKIPDNSIDFSVFSPPFSSLYVYSDSNYDMGNNKGDEEFNQHFKFLAEEMHRIMKSGREVAIHCCDIPAMKERDGYIGLKDFSGDVIRLFQSVGFIYHSRFMIPKNPLVEATRTKAIGLLHKQLCKDSSISRQGIPDYIIVMRKKGENRERISNGKGLSRFIGDETKRPKAEGVKFSHEVWRRYASNVWDDIRQSHTLNAINARDKKDERHICPLQLDVIDRCIELWSNKGDLVYSPFAGIGSEGYCAIKAGRRFIGSELKKSYFDVMHRHLAEAEAEQTVENLFA